MMGMSAIKAQAVHNAAAVQSQAFQQAMHSASSYANALQALSSQNNAAGNAYAYPSPRVSFMDRLRRRVEEIEALKGEMTPEEHDRWMSEAKSYSGD